MSKTTNMKEQSFTINTTLPTELVGLTPIKGATEIASKPAELIIASKYYSDALTELKIAKKVLKAAIDEPTKKIKSIDASLKALETEIKDKALSLVQTAVEQKVNAKTGEVTMEQTHNLPTIAFSFTPEKIVEGIDFDAIKAEYDKNGERSKYRHYFVKEVTYKLDLNKLKADLANGTKFPTSTKTTPEKISIQVKNLVDIKKQDEIKTAIEEAKPPVEVK